MQHAGRESIYLPFCLITVTDSPLQLELGNLALKQIVIILKNFA
jgi:hypothetical protein